MGCFDWYLHSYSRCLDSNYQFLGERSNRSQEINQAKCEQLYDRLGLKILSKIPLVFKKWNYRYTLVENENTGINEIA